MQTDEYQTIAEAVEIGFRERSSKFMGFGWPVTSEEEIREHLDRLRARFWDATHQCYAWRLGPRGERWRANDDGEPAGTAGRPIHGQMLSAEVTDCLIVAVRYFGGTKLGVPGLIAAYKEVAADVLAEARIELRTVERLVEVEFAYESQGEVMRVVKELTPKMLESTFDNICRLRLSIRQGRADELVGRLGKVSGLIIR